MPSSRGSFCHIAPAPGWKASSEGESLRLTSPENDALLQVTKLDPTTIEGGIPRWTQVCEHLNRLRGRSTTAVVLRSGLQGHATSFVAGDEWIRGWTLATPALGIDVAYRCPLVHAGRDDATVDAMISGLSGVQL